MTLNQASNSQNAIADPRLSCVKISEGKENCRSLVDVTHFFPPNPYI